MASLVYVCVRPEEGAATAEHASFRRGLGTDSLARIDLVSTPLDAAALDAYDGIVIGGSPFNVTDAEKSPVQQRIEADLERIAARALDGGTATMFTCYGIGVVTRMLGGALTLAHAESTRAAEITTTDAGASDALFGASAPVLRVFTAHKESALDVPPGAELLATNDDCRVQAYRVGDRLWATQFHPEPSPRDFADRMTFYRDNGYFSNEHYDAVEAEVLAARVDGAALLGRFAARAAGS